MKKQIHIKQGDKFGRLTALEYQYTGKHYRRYYSFRCDCGSEIILQVSNVSSGNTKSCGWLAREYKLKRISNNHSEITAIILGYKRHAIRRGFKFLLTRKDVANIINQNCYYCGDSPSNRKITKNSISGGLLYNGLDRVDSSKDYTLDNVVPSCGFCNRAKQDKPISLFIYKANKIANRHPMDNCVAKNAV